MLRFLERRKKKHRSKTNTIFIRIAKNPQNGYANIPRSYSNCHVSRVNENYEIIFDFIRLTTMSTTNICISIKYRKFVNSHFFV